MRFSYFNHGFNMRFAPEGAAREEKQVRTRRFGDGKHTSKQMMFGAILKKGAATSLL